MIPPHGGTLVNRFLSPQETSLWRERLPSLPRVRLTPRQHSDAQLIAQGAFSPLEGFLGHDDYTNVVREMRLSSGLPWSLPITLAVSSADARALRQGIPVALEAPAGQAVGILHLVERYAYDKELEAKAVYRTTDQNHPGVRALFQQGDVLLGGAVSLFESPPANGAFAPYSFTPAQTRAIFHERGWESVVGFQTRNPVHRAHEYIQKCALEIADGLLLHPLVGETQAEDVPAEVRFRSYEVLVNGYYRQERVLLAAFPAFMRYAGPREAVFHALVRKNYGCTHFIVGRDHAGVGNYYGPYDAQKIFEEFTAGELGITPLFFENAFYCRLCGAMATAKTCPHPEEEHVNLSGTQVRTMLRQGAVPPPEFTRPEVALVLAEAMSKEHPQ